MDQRNKLEVCFTPLLLKGYPNMEAIVVIIDVLRATSSICSAFANGVKSIIPVAETSEALEYKKKGFLVAGERDGIVLDFADFGNSPENFEPSLIAGKTVVYTTTNGTRTIHMASGYHLTIIGSFLNADALVNFLEDSGRDVLLLCAGWKDRFNLEDSVCAGYMASLLLETGNYSTECDSAKAAVDLWGIAREDLRAFIDKSSHRHRLKVKNLDHCIDFCLTTGFTDIVPMLSDGELIAAGKSYKER